jgi:hypothetical protein
MQKGIGVGKIKLTHAPPQDDKYKNVYCGKMKRAPSGMRRGTRYTCFKKGFGIGKELQWYGFDNLFEDWTMDDFVVGIFAGIIAMLLLSCGLKFSFMVALFLGIVCGFTASIAYHFLKS